MSRNPKTGPRLELAEDRVEALLSRGPVTDDDERTACLVLAGAAVTAAEGDIDQVKQPLRDALEAIGVIPYEPAQSKTPWGDPRHADDPYGKRQAS